jgi:DNA-binding Xre family transcriptional regulator
VDHIAYLGSVRLRVPELLRVRALTAYRLATDSGGRISMSMAYRLSRTGAFRCLSPEQLDALCELLDVEPGDLFEHLPRKKRRPK